MLDSFTSSFSKQILSRDKTVYNVLTLRLCIRRCSNDTDDICSGTYTLHNNMFAVIIQNITFLDNI